MQRTALPVTLLLALVFSFAPARGEEPMAYRFKEGSSSARIAFELNSNKIFLPVRINGGEERWFVLDSGCPVTAVDLDVARQLHLPVAEERTLAGAGEGRTAVGTTKVGSLALADLELFPRAVWALGVNRPVAPYEGRRIDGLLGVDFLERFVVQIDYPNRRLEVFEPLRFQVAEPGVVVPLTKVGGHYTVRGALQVKEGQSIEGQFILDVGVRLPLLLATPFVNRYDLIVALGAGKEQTVGGGLGGQTIAHLGRVKSLTIGELKIEAPFVALSQERRSFLAGDETQGLLGAEVFRRYCLTLDFGGKRAIFKEAAENRAPYEYDMSGMFLIAPEDNFHRFQVLSTAHGGPAAEAGIRPGDVIVEIDGKPAAQWTLEQLRASFRWPGAPRVLTVARQQERLTVKLRLRRLV